MFLSPMTGICMSINTKSKGSKSAPAAIYPDDVDLAREARSVRSLLDAPALSQSFTSELTSLRSSKNLSLFPSTDVFVQALVSEFAFEFELDGETGALGNALASILFSPM